VGGQSALVLSLCESLVATGLFSYIYRPAERVAYCVMLVDGVLAGALIEAKLFCIRLTWTILPFVAVPVADSYFAFPIAI